MPHLKRTIKNEGRETSRGPVVRTQSFHCQGGSIMVRKLKIQQAMQHSHIKFLKDKIIKLNRILKQNKQQNHYFPLFGAKLEES